MENQPDVLKQLTPEEWSWLEHYARDEQDEHAPLPTLAKLQHLGLLMRGWSQTYVVTARGRKALETVAAPLRVA